MHFRTTYEDAASASCRAYGAWGLGRQAQFHATCLATAYLFDADAAIDGRGLILDC